MILCINLQLFIELGLRNSSCTVKLHQYFQISIALCNLYSSMALKTPSHTEKSCNISNCRQFAKNDKIKSGKLSKIQSNE